MFDKIKKLFDSSSQCASMLAAIQNNDLEAVKSLYTININLLNTEMPFKKEKYVPLIWACRYKQYDILRDLYEVMENKEIEMDLSYALFIASIQKDNNDIIRYLLDAGANPNYVKLGGSPLWYSCEHGNLDAVKLLVDGGANINIKGTSTFLLCVYSPNIKGSRDILEYLIERGLELDVTEGNIYSTILRSRHDIIELLIGMDKLTSKQISEIALLVCKMLNADYVFYCNLRVRPNQKIGVKFITYLLNIEGVDINYQDKQGRTILIEASINKNIPLIEYLIAHGADKEIKDNARYTAKDYLKKKLQYLVK